MLPDYFEFQNSAKLLSGQYAIDNIPYELSRLEAEKPMLLSDAVLQKLGTLDIVANALKAANVEIGAVFTDIPADSSVEVVNRVAAIYRESGCNSIIAVGGGSVIDTAKGARMVLSQDSDDILALMGCETLTRGRQIPFVAVPTTSGTGSEATEVAVIRNPEWKIKMEFISHYLLPDVSVLDPRMTQTLPPRTTASTGMDALCHAIEGCTCLQNNPVSFAYGTAAIDLIRENLVSAVENGKDETVRHAMANASYLAGACFSNSMVGIVHAIGHALGGVCRVPHGEAMAILLPACMEYNLEKLDRDYGELLLHLAGPEVYAATPEKERGRAAIETVRSLRHRLHELCGLPETLSERKVDKADFPRVAKTALDDGAIIVNPRAAGIDDILAILESSIKEVRLLELTELIRRQRAYFASGKTLDPAGRRAALDTLYNALSSREDEINAALKQDLNKAPFETYMTETGMVLSEISFLRKHLAAWAKPRRVRTPLAQFPSVSRELHEPYGCVLIMAPWNYPLQLSLEPLAGAIAAGNTAIIKPSAYAPATSHALASLIGDCFDPGLAAVVEGGREENKALLDQKFDYIFFTGGVATGKVVMEAASRNLTPLTLELGGKSPCIVDETADLKIAARRLAFGKFLNAGQTCVAPDYLLVQRGVRDKLINLMQQEITKFFGSDPLSCENYPKIINEKHFKRVCGLLEGEKILVGGQSRDGAIAPTILEPRSPESPIMQEEIFGPVLPVLTFDQIGEVVTFVSARPKPLALYLFTRNKATENLILSRVSFGGGCVNDTIIHLATSHMGFGGVGASGMGSYHGKRSFDTFTHTKSVLKKANWLDLPMRYHPYTATNEKLLRIFLK